MSSRDHYVSQFHLRGFTDPTAHQPLEPWLWVGERASSEIRRKSPKNLAWSRGLFQGPGSLQDRKSTLENFLSIQVESPAANALRQLISRSQGTRSSVPPELTRYLAWSAARSLSMRSLFEEWIDNTLPPGQVKFAEPPLLDETRNSSFKRLFRMEHPFIGIRNDVPSEDVEPLQNEGWRFVLKEADFLELVHIQAYYFRARLFPRLQWIVLDPPPGQYFVIGDRPLVWGFKHSLSVEPRYLRHPNVQVFAPLTKSLGLFAFNPSGYPPEKISYLDFNRAIADAARSWVAGPTRQVVAEAMNLTIE